jgi:hypothetical protein
MSRALYVLTALALVAACDRPGDPAKTREFASRALRGALAYPNSSVVSVSAGDEAAELVLSTTDSMNAVADWYRRVLPLNGWELKRDVKDQAGKVTIYAEHGQRPLWITLQPNTGGSGTSYTLVGAIVDQDSTARKP